MSGETGPHFEFSPSDKRDDARQDLEPAPKKTSKEKKGSKKENKEQPVKRETREKLIIQHLPLVKAIAVRVHENIPVHVDLDDLVQAGVLGLFQAADRFNRNKKVAFSSFAKHRIKGAMLDSLRQLDWASRDMRRSFKKIEAATRDLQLNLQRKPSEQEIAKEMGMSLEDLRKKMLDLGNVGLISANSRTEDHADLPEPDFPGKEDSRPDKLFLNEQLRSTLAEAMKILPERYQKVMFFYYTKEMTMKEIGAVMKINESRVSQIHKLALEKLYLALRNKGINSVADYGLEASGDRVSKPVKTPELMPSANELLNKTCLVFGTTHRELMDAKSDSLSKMAAALVMSRNNISSMEIGQLLNLTEAEARTAAMLGHIEASNNEEFNKKIEKVAKLLKQ